MSLTSDKEKILSLKKKTEFSVISSSVDTYWEDTQLSGSCLFEMNITTPVELIEECSEYIDKDRARVITASAFKCKDAYEEKKKLGNVDDTFIPDFVYNF
jgi:hypothetical protein